RRVRASARAGRPRSDCGLPGGAVLGAGGQTARMAAQIVLVRHGETEWSRSLRHTGRTDVPLTPHGRQQAELIGEALGGRQFALVLTSPLERARETCRLAGFGTSASSPSCASGTSR